MHLVVCNQAIDDVVQLVVTWMDPVVGNEAIGDVVDFHRDDDVGIGLGLYRPSNEPPCCGPLQTTQIPNAADNRFCDDRWPNHQVTID